MVEGRSNFLIHRAWSNFRSYCLPFSFRFCPTPSSQSPLGASPFSQPISLILSPHSIWLPRREGTVAEAGSGFQLQGRGARQQVIMTVSGRERDPQAQAAAAVRGMTDGEWLCTNDYSIYPAYSSYIYSNLNLSPRFTRVIRRIRI